LLWKKKAEHIRSGGKSNFFVSEEGNKSIANYRLVKKVARKKIKTDGGEIDLGHLYSSERELV